MKTVIVIQARLGSSRLPCKTLLNLHGLPVIDWVVGRCARSELADDLVVALPDTRRDEVLARHLRAQGVNTFRGSEQDVLSRMHGAAAAHGADLVVRVCADNPLIWGGEIDNLIRFYQREHTAGNCDYAYNHIPRNNLYPDGLGAEIVSFELFTKAMNEATLPAHREHCLSYIVDNPELFAIRTFDPLDPALPSGNETRHGHRRRLHQPRPARYPPGHHATGNRGAVPMKSILFIILLVGWVVWGFRWMIGKNRRSVPS